MFCLNIFFIVQEIVSVISTKPMKMYVDMMKIWRNETSQLFDMQTIRLKFVLVIFWLIAGDECRKVHVQTGGSVTIPCHYESKYTQLKKYWCYNSLGYYPFCSILAYANETKGDVSVIDHPDQSLFTVTMRDLQEKNTGTYWCAVEIEGITSDATEWFYLKIQSAPGVSVMPSSVTVDEGGNIGVQCLYTSTYKNKTKQWCRYKDKRCYTVGSSDTSQYSAEISDNGRGSLTVVMSGLMKSDSGWYYCSVGHLQAPVQLTINAVTTDSSSTRNIQYDHLKMWLLPIILLLLLILVTVTSVMLKNKHRRNNNYISNEERDKASDEDDPECDVTYSSVINLPKTEAREPADVEENVIYSSVCE
ncbi:polymeric immunoglobulin receptor-like [Paramisgurnus dabryanus]|uniref:polymeric immunoglobulin receptor-like n=1 Tax=Paramisgurnus dabryanus TaxID=90735 RepID=UPI0031F398C0